MRRICLIANLAPQHSLMIAEALKVDFDVIYITSSPIFSRKSSVFALFRLPCFRFLLPYLKRNITDIEDIRLHRSYLTLFVRSVFRLLRVDRTDFAILLTNLFFDLRIALHIFFVRPHIFIGYEMSSSISGCLCQWLGGKFILDKAAIQFSKQSANYPYRRNYCRDLVERIKEFELFQCCKIVVPSYVVLPAKYYPQYINKSCVIPYCLVGLSHLDLFMFGDRSEVATESKRKISIGFVGSSESHKGFQILKDALDRLNNESNSDYLFILQVYGESWSISSNYIKFCGRFSRVDLLKNLSLLDFVVIPSVYESFSLLGLECYSFGIPFAISSGAGFSSYVETSSSRVIFKPNVDDLCHAILNLARNCASLDFRASFPSNISLFSKSNFFKSWRGIALELSQDA